MNSLSAESALALIREADDIVTLALSNEEWGSRVRPLVTAYRADSVSPTHEVREPIVYREPISERACAAVVSRGPITWEERQQ